MILELHTAACRSAYIFEIRLSVMSSATNTSGGSSMHRPSVNSRPKKTPEVKKNDARQRAIALLGQSRITAIQEKWNSLNTLQHGEKGDGDLADGILTCLQKCGMSNIMIRSILPCGGSRLQRVRHKNSNAERETPKRSHALNDVSVNLFKLFIKSLDVEDGFPCPHRRPKQYVTKDNKATTWKILHQDYTTYVNKEKEKISNEHVKKQVRTLALNTFREYRGWIFPGHCLSRKKEDVCDHCMRLKLVLENELTPTEEKEQARKELEMHQDAAICQRRALKAFTKEYLGSLLLPCQPVRMPDYIDGDSDGEEEEENRNSATEDTVQVAVDHASHLQSLESDNSPLDRVDRVLEQVGTSRSTGGATANNDPSHWDALLVAEDYGQGIPFPFFGFRRPQSDYFHCNLMNNVFVLADMSRKKSNVFLYDERCMGKDKDALCSLRLKFHLESIQERRKAGRNPPTCFISVRDNCVGQNKSNVTMMFDCWLSLCFYERVLVLYLIPGHSHMMADRVVAWVKGAIQHKDLFVPSELVNAINEVKGITADFLSHSDPERECWKEWGKFLGKYLKKMPAGFTHNYVFEFHQGTVTMKHLFTDTEGAVVKLCTHPSAVSKAMWSELFGTTSRDVTTRNVKLPRHPNIQLQSSKIRSISKKFDMIPEEHLSHYPQRNNLDEDEEDCSSDNESTVPKTPKPNGSKRKKKTTMKAPGAKRNKVGRPKTTLPITNQKSIMMFMKTKLTAEGPQDGDRVSAQPIRETNNGESDADEEIEDDMGGYNADEVDAVDI